MKIFSARQLKKADEITLLNQSISSEELMERAARLVFERIHASLNGTPTPIKIFCGVGNNGGDGLVIGRLLLEKGYNVSTYIVNYSDKRSRDFLSNYDRIKDTSSHWPIMLTNKEDFPEFNKEDLIIDSIFGIGLNRPLIDWVAALINTINDSEAFVISVDVPSGMRIDAPDKESENIIRADHTFSFQTPKLAFFLPETGAFAGNIEILDIGLDGEYMSATKGIALFIEKPEARALVKHRDKFSHKGTFGHALLVGGSYGKMGSICLTATACMRSGAGMATVFAPRCGHDIVQTSLPEAMLITDAAEKYITSVDFDLDPVVICFGVGVGQQEKTLKAFEELLEKTEKPMLIDADGLNLLSRNPRLLKKLPKDSVLTPHPKELERLLGKWENDHHKLEKAQEFVKEHQLILVIKGAHSMVVSAEEIYVNSTGNPGMASAGSGDVLAGVITGLLAQQYDPLNAAVLGVFLHGKAGDIAARNLSKQAIIAGDIAGFLGAAYLDLLQEDGSKNS